MGQGAPLARGWTRRSWLGAAAFGAAGCAPGPGTGTAAGGALAGGWVGAALARGHALHAEGPHEAPAAGAPPRRCAVAVVGAGVAGLAAAPSTAT
ncbi:MAG: hypothetical protein RLZZ341_1269, partial [Pseudomonadota bacterium]